MLAGNATCRMRVRFLQSIIFRQGFIAFMLLAGILLTAADVYAQPTFFSSKGCVTCHSAPVVRSCNACHKHGANISGATNKATYAPGETVAVTINGGSKGGWVRAGLYDQNMVELARSNGNDSGMGSSTPLPAVFSAPAPTVAGTYAWKVFWYGNSFGRGSSTNWIADPTNPNHGQVVVSTNSFKVTGPQDNTAPTVSAFTLPADSSSLSIPVTSFTATDNVAVNGYLVTTSSTTPLSNASGWKPGAPTSLAAPAPGTITFYAWARDAAGNVSSFSSAIVNVTVSVIDKARPKVTSFTLPATSPSLTVPITTFVARDDIAVTGYLITSSKLIPDATAIGWTSAAPTTATATTTNKAGKATFYAWAKDASGRISSARKKTVKIVPAIENDGDGFSENQGDCNDTSSAIFPGGTEICGDGIDQDCSGADLICPIDPNTVDDDGDGFSENQGDCNDANAAIRPGATEVCGDGIDPDCSGADLPCQQGTHTSDPDCVKCHGIEATEVHGSLHYQWQGPAPYMVNLPATPQGKLTNAVNSYCISILGNWAGCSTCHVGKGAKPEPVATQAQLANIDCLKCHSQGGAKPTRVDCLTCHAKAGGGDAVKRGDLALATGNTTDINYDVHMATTGANLKCQGCHITQNHRIAGKGSDLRATDLDVKVTCTNCHNASPHDNSNLNRHTGRVACQTCHIPVYAKNAADSTATEATETFRTWRYSEAATPPLHPASTKANNLMPKYRFWNGKSDNYLLGDMAKLDSATGKYPTSRPVGSVQDGKLYPFKYKTAEQPITIGSNMLIALDTKVFFATADPTAAVRQGLLNMGMSETTPWEWVLTDTFQMLNHQVGPKEQALDCASCHDSTARMNLKGQLGYQLKAAQSTVCTQCHGIKEQKPFQTIHDKHVKDKQYDCSWCHTFSRPERGLRMP